MKILTIPLNSDNFGYFIIDEINKLAAVVDVSSQPDEILKIAEDQGLSIIAILTTHKHMDHAGGNGKIKEMLPHIEIYGSRNDSVEACTRFIEDGDVIELLDFRILCLATPGHTLGHICYYIDHEGERVVFTGDTLFVGGCGKFFEGTASDMYPSLYGKLATLPEDTLVYCGHEYTLSNYRFALSVDPLNAELLKANDIATNQIANNVHTVPSTIGRELATNPFLRVATESIKKSLHLELENDNVLTLAALREAKNRF